MEGNRTVIVLPSIGSSDYDQTIEAMSRQAQSPEETLLVPLGFNSTSELNRFNATIVYPEDFFDRKAGEQIDSDALRLARSWYLPLGNDIEYNGVNLAQMCEYSFYFIFVDCLRSIAIAKGLIDSGQIGRLILPQTTFVKEISEICYESLPNALEQKAKENGIAVKRVGTLVPKDSSENGTVSRGWDKPHLYEWFLEVFSPLARKNAVIFQNVYAFEQIAFDTRSHGLRPLRSFPYRRSNARTREFSEGLASASVAMIKKILDEQDDETVASRLAKEIAQDRLKEFFLQIVPMLAEYVEWADFYSKKMRPKVVVCMEDITPVNRSISRVLRDGGAHVVVLQHGLLTKDMAGYYLMPIEGSIQAVWGQYFMEWHINRGKDPNSLAITGSPIYESIRSNEEELEIVKQKLGLDADRPILLIGTSRYSGISSVFTLEKEKRFFDGVYAGIGSENVYQIVTKMHPSCGKPYYDMANESAVRNGVRTILTKDNLRELLNLTLVVAIPNSTIGYEAVLLKKPLVCVDFEAQGEEGVFVSGGVAIGVERANELSNGIKAAIAMTRTDEYGVSRNRFIEYHLDGSNPSSKIAGLINKLYRSD